MKKIILTEMLGSFESIIASGSFTIDNDNVNVTKRIVMCTTITTGRNKQAKTTVNFALRVNMSVFVDAKKPRVNSNTEDIFEKLEDAVVAFNS